MKYTEKIIRSGDSIERGMPPMKSAQEIDRILSELGSLYIQRLKALRLGTSLDVQIISDRIVALKSRLAQL